MQTERTNGHKSKGWGTRWVRHLQIFGTVGMLFGLSACGGAPDFKAWDDLGAIESHVSKITGCVWMDTVLGSFPGRTCVPEGAETNSWNESSIAAYPLASFTPEGASSANDLKIFDLMGGGLYSSGLWVNYTQLSRDEGDKLYKAFGFSYETITEMLDKDRENEVGDHFKVQKKHIGNLTDNISGDANTVLIEMRRPPEYDEDDIADLPVRDWTSPYKE